MQWLQLPSAMIQVCLACSFCLCCFPLFLLHNLLYCSDLLVL